jgi:DNA-binding transcriptional ArsR family regulator
MRQGRITSSGSSSVLTGDSPEIAMVCSRTPSNLLGVPLRFTEEFEVVIMIAVADRRDGWVGPLPDLRDYKRAWCGTNKSQVCIVSLPPLIYTLTSICSMEYMKRVGSVFEIIAEPNRRAILSLLVSSQQSVGEIERRLGMPQTTVSKHLRVLRVAGFVESTVDAQRRLYRLKPEPLQELDAWLAPFRRFWSAHVDALERHLDRMDRATPPKKKTTRKRRGPNRERDNGEKK